MSAITINIPESLHNKLKEIAERDNSTPEQLAVLAHRGEAILYFDC